MTLPVSMLCALKEKAFAYEKSLFRVVNCYHVTSKHSLFISLTNVQKISEMCIKFFLIIFDELSFR